MDNITGLGTGISLLIVGLVMTIANLGPGAMVGIPVILLSFLVPLVMTYNARTESIRQERRRRPERDSSATYTIESKNHRRRRQS